MQDGIFQGSHESDDWRNTQSVTKKYVWRTIP